MANYPRDLKMFVNKMSGYSRNTLKITPYRTNSVNAGDIVTVDLPNSSMLDLNTLIFHFKGTTTASGGEPGYANFPKNIESIISKVTVEINGQTLPSCQNMSDLYNMLLNFQSGSDFKGKRALYQNSTAGQGDATANETSRPFKIQHWLGFAGTVLPEVLDTALLGAVRLHIQLEGGNVLIGGNGATSASYSLNDLWFSVDSVSIDDGVYYAAKNSYLASGGVFEMPFDNWYSSLFSTGGSYLQSSRFSLSTNSLDLLMATFPKTRVLSSNVAALSNCGYFQYDGSGVADYQFSVNNISIPQFKPSGDEAYCLALNALNLSQDTLGGIDSDIIAGNVAPADLATKWKTNFFTAACRLDHPTASDERIVSGINCLGTNAQITFDTTAAQGAGAINNALLFAKTTSILRVGSGKALEIIS